MAGMECGRFAARRNSKRKAAEAALGDESLLFLSDRDNTVGVDAAVAPAPEEMEAAPWQPKAIMSQALIDSVLARETKPLTFNERLLRDPKLAAIFQSHEKSRAKFAEYQSWIRRQLETKGCVEVDDDYEHAVHKAVFYGREDEEKEAMAKLEAMRRS